jgi:hypothetical protein
MIESKPIIELTANEVKTFFLKNESYCNIDIPDYINFEPLLNKLSTEIGQQKIREICENAKENHPKELEQINHILLTNKDGLFAWRPFMLLNPAIYILLVNVITNEDNWNIIVHKFNESRTSISDKIDCISIPVVSLSEERDKAAQINKWWTNFEQQSLSLALDYTNITHADLTNCYGSIYTHSIPWAIHGKEECKKNLQRNRNQRIDLFGDDIDLLIRADSFGQTNGIPQGNVLMDFIAELVLNYIDLEIYSKLGDIECKIIRYRDDYRIFTNSEIDSLKVLKIISEVTAQLSMKLNDKKTVVSNNIIKDSLKSDKWYYIDCLDCVGKRYKLQKHLLLIHKLSLEFPNSGSVRKELFKFYKRLYKRNRLNDNVYVLISIVADISFKNPSTYPVSSAIISKLLTFVPDNEKEEIIDKLITRFDSIPNTGLVDLWLQRITITIGGISRKTFDETLCDIVKNASKMSSDLWDISWLQQRFQNIFNKVRIVDDERIVQLSPVISIEEIELFIDNY